MENLSNKTAYVTGGSKGIGYGIAEKLMANGVNVVITSRSEDSANRAATKLNGLGHPGKCTGVKADVRNLTSQQQAVEKAKQAYGSLDIVVANAGVGHFAPIQEMSPEQWNETIDINLTGTFNTIKASVDELIATKGYFFTIASLAGTNFFAGGAAYNASKFGVVGFTQAVMLDVRKQEVKCTTIMPGSVATHFNGNEPDDSDAWKIQIEDLGQLVVDLLKMPARTLPSKVEVRPAVPKS
ncbi:NADP-dependent 3-hydroxy acid dehydrogenase YdfG [Neolewinella xylanilytica]|uniref:NADP-dependent 3-hydroxy acid dehydrogenase YdfG n=1 Tax=Neolewinella xylanilytica TaxID=1514080 RepID=A0A2S6I543_9BACT|nr:SDR family oxidoreductase [Neolewinella xylanilytica]PPK86249.1 NADP-dependent 3-hydroxy acid dehydrogenase YdfG [Neolewinella xylanilytica]